MLKNIKKLYILIYVISGNRYDNIFDRMWIIVFIINVWPLVLKRGGNHTACRVTFTHYVLPTP